MLTTAYYFLQVILCSGLMMGYYWLVLRNKRFHQYNRFYLLAIALLSWIVPLIKIKWGHQVLSNDPQMLQLLSVVADSNSQIEENLSQQGFQWNLDSAAVFIYIAVAGILLLGMIRAFVRLYQLLKNHSCRSVGDVYLILTQAKGTPFSFFRYIFWNEEIDIRSEAGKQILQHELTHVKEKHSFDKLFIQVMLIAGWFNPLFWLLRREMDMIHEFIADRKVVSNGDTASLAQMLLTAAYPQQQFALTNPFFFSPIKRRLQMLNNNKHPRFSYIRRLVVLPLLAIVVVLFAFRSKEQRKHGTLSVASVVEHVVDAIAVNSFESGKPDMSVFDEARLDRTYTVVIDAGHGGTDKGVTGADGTTESQITLQLAKQIKQLNENEQIRIVLTRETDEFQTVVKKAELANQYHPDLFLSLHCNDVVSAQNNSTGIEMFIASKNRTTNYEASQVLATRLTASLEKLNEKMLGIKSREKGVWVLQNVQSPAVLLEAGFITNKDDLQKLKAETYQKQMALSILQGINNFLSKPVQTKLNLNSLGLDTIVIKQAGKEDEIKVAFTPQNNALGHALMILDGEKADTNVLRSLNPTLIHSVNILKGESANALYGEEGKNGVVLITTKEAAGRIRLSYADSIPNLSLASVINYGKKDNADVKDFLKRNPFVKDVYWWAHQSLKMQIELKNGTEETYDLSKPESKERAEKKYGKLPVAPPPPPPGITVEDIKLENVNKQQVNVTSNANTNVTVDNIQPGTNTNAHLKDIKEDTYKVFTQAQKPAEFPGGIPAWTKYLERNLNRDIIVKKGGPPGTYIVKLQFTVSETGTVSDVRALNDPGYGAAAEAVRLIQKGPSWKPAVQNGVEVSSVHTQSITWIISEPAKKKM